jgi:hypothetical protein
VTTQKEAALQIGFVRFDIFRPAFFRRPNFGLNLRLGSLIGRSAGELSAQLLDDGLGKLGLKSSGRCAGRFAG